MMPGLTLPRSLLLCADQVIGRIGDDRYDSTLDRLVSTRHYGCCSCLRFDVGSSTPGNLRRRASEDRSRRPLSLPHARLGRRTDGPRRRREHRLLVALDGRGVCKEMIFDASLGHALFYTPDRLWVDPAVGWALGREID